MAMAVDQTLGVREEYVVRVAASVTGLVLTVLGLGLLFRAGWATAIIPWDDDRMSFILMSSLVLAAATALLWIAITKEVAAMAQVLANAIALFATAAGSLAVAGFSRDDNRLLAAAGGLLILVVFFVWSSFWTQKFRVHDPRPVPRFVRISFVLYFVVLVAVGVALVFQVDNVLPWDPHPQSSTLFGCFFLGAAAYFAFAIPRPRWIFAEGALWSFLVYDVILVAPYIGLLLDRNSTRNLYGSSAGDDLNELSLAIYLLVITFSAGVTIWYVLVHPATRVNWRFRQLESEATLAG